MANQEEDVPDYRSDDEETKVSKNKNDDKD